jgi:spore maturation protein CgeB
MKLVVFGLSVSSSWGNGHATLWRGLCAALARRGHRVVFLERDVPYYASHRDLTSLPGGGDLIFYDNWPQAVAAAAPHLADTDVAMVTSYCPDGVSASQLVLESRAGLRVFYDLDTPVTLERLTSGQPVEYLGPRGLRDFDLVLSYTGGDSLDGLRVLLGARCVAPLYGSVDPAAHTPAPVDERYRGDLGYLGTFAADRQAILRELFVEPARRLPRGKFLLAGSMYDDTFPWLPNIHFLDHLPPGDHPAFYCSTRLTLNVTRRSMAMTGYCPSGRLFEAAACGAAIVSDYWSGLEQFFEPGEEILLAGAAQDTLDALARSPDSLARLGKAARERALAAHTADHRAVELERLLDTVYRPRSKTVETA